MVSKNISKGSLIIFTVIQIVFMSTCVRMQSSSVEAGYFTPKNPPQAKYALDVNIRVEGLNGSIEGSGSIEFKNTSGRPMSVIALEWVQIPSALLNVFMTGDKDIPLTAVETWKRAHFFQLPEPMMSGKKINLKLQYSLEISEIEEDLVISQFFYPRLWWDGLPTQDSVRVKLDIPDGFTLASSGRYNPDTGYLENKCVTSCFGFCLFRNAEVEEREVEGVLVRAIFKEDGRDCALLCLETAVDVIKFYKNIHGFYPHASLTIVPGASRPMGGFPFASALVVIHGQEAFDKAPLFHWKWITAHEIGHQYWGEYVMSADEPDSYLDSWLMIGMGIFADRMWVEARGLEDSKHLGFFNRYLNGVKHHLDITADAPESLRMRQSYDRNNILIHGKGFSIISALRSALGDEIFKETYMRCIREYGGKRLSYRDFQRIAEEVSGEHLGWFFDQWVRSSLYLCYKISSQKSYQEEGGYYTEIVVERMGDSMSMLLEVKVIFDDESEQTAITSRFLRKNKLVFRSMAELEQVVLDPKNRLAMLEDPVTVLPEELPVLVRKLAYYDEYEEGLRLFNAALEADIKDRQIWNKLGMVVFQGGYLDEAFICFQRILDMNPMKDYHFLSLTWMGNIRDAQGRREEAVRLYSQALNLYTDDWRRYDQFGIEYSDKWIQQRLKQSYDWSKIIKQQGN